MQGRYLWPLGALLQLKIAYLLVTKANREVLSLLKTLGKSAYKIASLSKIKVVLQEAPFQRLDSAHSEYYNLGS